MVFRAGMRSVITVCPRAKICFTESAMHYECENLQLFLGNYNLKFGVNG